MDYLAYAIEIVAFQSKLQRKRQRKFGNDSILNQTSFESNRIDFYMRKNRKELETLMRNRAHSFGAFENDKFRLLRWLDFDSKGGKSGEGAIKYMGTKEYMAGKLAECDSYLLYEFV